MKINSISQTNYTQQNQKRPHFNALHKSFENLSPTELKRIKELVARIKGYYLKVLGNNADLVIATRKGSKVENVLLSSIDGYTSIDENQAEKLIGRNIEIDEKTLGDNVDPYAFIPRFVPHFKDPGMKNIRHGRTHGGKGFKIY